MLDDHAATIGIDGVNLRVVRHEDWQSMSMGVFDSNRDTALNAFCRLVQCRSFKGHWIKISHGMTVFNQP